MAEISHTEKPVSPPEPPIIELVHRLILDAHRLNASDVHLEPSGKHLRIRYRIDGKLQEMPSPPTNLQSAITSRIKIQAHMSLAEKRLCQDGRFSLQTGDNRKLDLRVSLLPTIHGEGVAIRILEAQRFQMSLDELGLSQHHQTRLRQVIHGTDGMFLITGPTGSGKTTTLYACLYELNHPERKIITIEDPVEYQLSGMNQIQVNETAGMNFAKALRSILRQSPDIIMIGEIRDTETARIAANSALTGHLVFSTLHTNDAPSAPVRLMNMGLEPFLTASALRAVMAQRLVRKICTACAGNGCAKCRQTGYQGRTGIFELMDIDDEIRMLIHQRAGADVLKDVARQNGMMTLREDGMQKADNGLTSSTEILSTTMDSGL